MPQIQRSTDVKEQLGTQALLAIIPGVLAIAMGALILVYSKTLIVLAILLLLGGVAATIYGVVQFSKVRKIHGTKIRCPFCGAETELFDAPEKDFTCMECHRLVPLENGAVVKVSQVRCGYCGALNYYSEKSTGLICEECAREIPLAAADEDEEGRQRIERFAYHEDPNPYDLVLTSRGMKQEELLACLQKMLALNRNQVKEIIATLPAVLLTGIPRKKAELLKQDIVAHGGKADVSETPRPVG